MILLEASIQLVPDGTLLLHLFLVGVMVFVLNRTLLKPVNQILAEREKQIAGRLKEAEAMALETQEKLKKYNDALRDARADGYKLLEKERAQTVGLNDCQLPTCMFVLPLDCAPVEGSTRRRLSSERRDAAFQLRPR